MPSVRFIMIGGFLGAGKTTMIARLARRLVDAGRRVGIVTNDQAYNLVDTQTLRAEGFDVGEVPGACFCCKFNDLVATVAELSSGERPDVIIAEPVGSCTDLVATVVEPLEHLYAGQYDVAPYAVLLKPEHGQKILAGEDGVGFSEKAAYIFLKQIEEADVVAINKVDKLTAAERDELVALVAKRFPDKHIVAVSGRSGEGCDELFARLDDTNSVVRFTPEVDYDVYAEGEAELGWLNCTVHVERAEPGDEPFGLDELLMDFVDRLRVAIDGRAAETAHLKVFAESAGNTALANVVIAGGQPELSRRSQAQVESARFNVNARVAIDPQTLADIVADQSSAMAVAAGLVHRVSDVQSFRPGRPVPTHRMPRAG